MIKLFLNVLFVLLFVSANAQTVPSAVVSKFIQSVNMQDFTGSYDLLSEKSKINISLRAYIDFYKGIKHKETEVKEIFEVPCNDFLYKRVRVDAAEFSPTAGKLFRKYYTLVFESGMWKILWAANLISSAKQQMDSGNYEKAEELFLSVLEINPFNDYACDKIAWCYYLNDKKEAGEKLNGMNKYSLKAVTLAPDIAKYYRIRAVYYGNIKQDSLEFECIGKSIESSLNESDRDYYYSDMSNYYMKKDFEKSLNYIGLAIGIDSANTFFRYTRGMIYFNYELYEKAADDFNKAISMEEMSGYSQANLYGCYSVCCYTLNNISEAGKYIVKAIALEPDNQYWRSVYEYIKMKKNSLSL